MVGPLEKKLDKQAESDPLCCRRSGWWRLRPRNDRPSKWDELPICPDLHRSHFTMTIRDS